jgi:hypothetical protein
MPIAQQEMVSPGTGTRPDAGASMTAFRQVCSLLDHFLCRSRYSATKQLRDYEAHN